MEQRRSWPGVLPPSQPLPSLFSPCNPCLLPHPAGQLHWWSTSGLGHSSLSWGNVMIGLNVSQALPSGVWGWGGGHRGLPSLSRSLPQEGLQHQIHLYRAAPLTVSPSQPPSHHLRPCCSTLPSGGQGHVCPAPALPPVSSSRCTEVILEVMPSQGGGWGGAGPVYTPLPWAALAPQDWSPCRAWQSCVSTCPWAPGEEDKKVAPLPFHRGRIPSPLQPHAGPIPVHGEVAAAQVYVPCPLSPSNAPPTPAPSPSYRFR